MWVDAAKNLGQEHAFHTAAVAKRKLLKMMGSTGLAK